MAASEVISVSMEPPSVLVAVNQNAGLHPVLMATDKLCINFLARSQLNLLDPFSRTEMRDQRFASDEWRNRQPNEENRPPWLMNARAVVVGSIDRIVPYGSHTLFIALVDEVLLSNSCLSQHPPLIWLDGKSVALSDGAI